MQIHPTALVHPGAHLGHDVRIGPYCIIEDDVLIDDGCILEARVSIKNGTSLGTNNRIFEGAVIGGLPQCVDLDDVESRVIIGSGNTIRENVTIHRSMKEDDATEIGDDCMFMVNTHIAHDCRIADGVIMANNVMIAGHVSIGSRAFLSGAVGVHQFCRIGTLAMVGGQAHIVKDVPPYVTVDGISSEIVGLNVVGLRRAKFSVEDRKTLKAVYKILYSNGMPWSEIVKKIEAEYTRGPGLEMARFIATTTRGITPERHTGVWRPGGADTEPATLRLHLVTEDELDQHVAKRIRETG